MARRCSLLMVLLCLQASASILALRRDPVDRLRGAVVSGLVWTALRRIELDGGADPPRT